MANTLAPIKFEDVKPGHYFWAKKGDVWNNMKKLFSDTEIVEISMASAMFNMINRLNDSFWTELETVEYNRKQGDAVKGRTVEQIEAYAGRFAETGKAAREAAAVSAK